MPVPPAPPAPSPPWQRWVPWAWLMATATMLVMVVVALVPASARGAHRGPTAIELTQALRTPVDVPTGTPMQPQPVTLPDWWDHAKPLREGVYRYDVAVPLKPEPGVFYDLFIARAGNSLRVELNGHLIEQFGALHRPYANYAGLPLEVGLPSSFLRPDGQTLTITVAGEPFSTAGLSQVWIGPSEVIDPMMFRAEWVQVRGVWVVSGATAVLGLMSLLLWVRIRQRLYLYYAIASLVWAARILMPLAVVPLAPVPLWNWFFFVSYSAYIALVSLFSLDVIAYPHSGLRRMEWGFLALSMLLLTISVFADSYTLRSINNFLSIGAAFVPAVMVTVYTFRQPETGRVLLSLAAIVAVAVGIRDYVVIQINPAGYGEYTWARYASVLFMMTLAWIVMERFSRAMQGFQTSARFYEIQFSRKQSELEATYDQLREAEKRQAVEDERRRIMREMHDGLGSTLVTAMSLVDRGDTKQAPLIDALSDCMGELRMAIDALQPHDNDLLAALGTLRTRIAPALERAGIKLRWEVEPIPAIDRLTPEATLQLYRFVQEAISNAIKHSGATELTLRATFDWKREWVSVMIDDNGRGWNPFEPGTRRGGGTDSLRARASALDGIARISALKPGTRVQLSFPRGPLSSSTADASGSRAADAPFTDPPPTVL
ncbi:MAG: sensor histidine kinase [Betaproteobacteria bacterium]|nr:sensor histidine kinase [Betaproteobacteria bacterium]